MDTKPTRKVQRPDFRTGPKKTLDPPSKKVTQGLKKPLGSPSKQEPKQKTKKNNKINQRIPRGYIQPQINNNPNNNLNLNTDLDLFSQNQTTQQQPQPETNTGFGTNNTISIKSSQHNRIGTEPTYGFENNNQNKTIRNNHQNLVNQIHNQNSLRNSLRIKAYPLINMLYNKFYTNNYKTRKYDATLESIKTLQYTENSPIINQINLNNMLDHLRQQTIFGGVLAIPLSFELSVLNQMFLTIADTSSEIDKYLENTYKHNNNKINLLKFLIRIKVVNIFFEIINAYTDIEKNVNMFNLELKKISNQNTDRFNLNLFKYLKSLLSTK